MRAFLALLTLWLISITASAQQIGSGCTPIGRGANTTGFFSDCTVVTGTANAIILTPILGNVATVPQMAKFATYRFQATATNTTAVTLRLGAAGPGPYNVYKRSAAGSIALTGGEIVNGSFYSVVFDPLLNSSAGGWVVDNQVGSAGNIGQLASSQPVTIGSSLYPVYQNQITTTANTTSGNAAIVVASATGIVVGDSIFGTFAPAGVYVASIVGTTITMGTATGTGVSPNATATGTGTAVAFGGPRYSQTSTFMANTLAARDGLFGAAALGRSTWVNRYFPGADYQGAGGGGNTIYSISPDGRSAGLFAVRSSDATAGTGSAIALATLIVADRTTGNVATWGQYTESRLLAAAVQNEHNQYESSIANFWTAVDITPYAVNPAGSVRNFRIDCGVGATISGQTKCSAALDVVNNGQTYRSGFVIAADALDVAAGRIAPAYSMATNQAVVWYSTAGIGWSIWSDATTNANNGMVLHDNNAEFTTVISVLDQVAVRGSTSGTLRLAGPATVGGDFTIRFPGGSTNFTATGGASQVVFQTSVGGAFTVARPNCATLSDSTALCSAAVGSGVVTALGVNVGNTGSVIVNGGAAAVTFVTASSYTLVTAVVVGSLPSCAVIGQRATVSDSNAVSYTAGIGSVVAGGGSTKVPVFCDGTSWRIGELTLPIPANDNRVENMRNVG